METTSCNNSEITLFNVKYDNLTVERAVRNSLELAVRGEKSNIFFLNIDCLNKAIKDEEYRRILNSASLVLPDGIGLKLATSLFGAQMLDNCNGSDLSPLLLEEFAKQGEKIFLLGGEPGVVEKAATALKKQIPELQIVGTHSGFFQGESIIEEINASGATVLFVGMGVPLQEKWIAKNRNRLNPKLCIGVGALFDWLSGNRLRSPFLLRRLKLEWLWRILLEPKRMFKRYLIDDMNLMAFLVYHRLKLEIQRKEDAR